jgi:hypothetical protein
MSAFCWLLALVLTVPALADDVPRGCDFANSPGQEATLACYQDLDRNGDAALSRDEADALPRTRGRFDQLDVDGNGSLSPNELQAGVTTPSQRTGDQGGLIDQTDAVRLGKH